PWTPTRRRDTNCRTGGNETARYAESPPPLTQCRDRFSSATVGATAESRGHPTRQGLLPCGTASGLSSWWEWCGRESVCGQTRPIACILHSGDTHGGPQENAQGH